MVQLPFSSSAPNGVSSQPPSRSSTPALSPPSRTVSPSPSSHSIAHRPQPPDSLHSRIRSANPPPASTPLFVDVLSPPSRTATPTPLSPPGTPSQAELPGSGEGGPSADIGIYPDAIYDEYLGSFIGGIRRALVRNLKRESRFIAWHQVSAAGWSCSCAAWHGQALRCARAARAAAKQRWTARTAVRSPVHAG
jgi:hypothetical protein